MQAKREYRDRAETEVAVLDALVDRAEEGMTVFELRSGTETDIDDLEAALSTLKEEGLITVENSDDEPMRIYPEPKVVPEPSENGEEPSLLSSLRDRLGL
ncbi:uncharacterized protein NP_0434A [Natronomonas pharaonis DSM 2160]|uniref:HTH domain protein n=1 Tax=Natronomonas pharaonis (strain ATCC 35678 / DSM 2160 / CIP 103997 / JCM 8858 / NBRC 14720 / NCIMB 2260 / Gabara) TaxID=348780 RepID=A0A1U7ETQ6_NATPD|nr:DUF6432 family protein [Natronomonas pharaonis]CAI48308.1 uncharacterized protein NP_0434A [Natronomonas pharaonis DSM 2160]